MRPAAALLAIALALGASACAGHGEAGIVPPLAIPLASGASDASFVRLVETAHTLGYVPDFVEPEYGVFGVPSHHTPGRGEVPIVFVVQCYADGRATLTALGGRAQGRPDRVRVPDDVRREAVALAQDLAGGYAR